MAGFKVRLPVKIGTAIAPFLNRVHLLWRPDVEIDGLDLGDVCTHTTVNARASNAQETAAVRGEAQVQSIRV